MQLYQHQKEALEILKSNGYKGYIALPPGLGKTLIGCMAIKQSGSRKPVIVAPKSAFLSWEKELSTTGIHNAIVVNYEKLLAYFKRNRKLPLTDFLILDEAHRIKNIKAKTTKLLMAYGKLDIPKVLLSGTPYKHLLDLYSQFYVINPSLFGSYKDYLSAYFQEYETPWGTVDYRPVKDAERLILQRVKGYFYRKDRDEIKDLKRVEVVYRIPTPLEHSWELFKSQIIDEVLEEGYREDDTVSEIVKRLRGKFIEKMRLAQIENRYKKEYIADFVADNPDTVVFTLFKDEAYQIGKIIDGYVITSQTPQKERMQIVKKQDKPIVFTQALSEGADLTGYRNMIFACVPSSPIMFSQVAGRIDRLSQKAGLITYIYMLDEFNDRFYTLLNERRQSSDYFNEIAKEIIEKVKRKAEVKL